MRTWKQPFAAILFNEADEPHDEIKLKVCRETIIRKGRKYRLVEFAASGATYKWCGFAPAEKSTPTVR